VLTQGVGTEQLEECLSKLFITANVVRVDSDSARGKNKLEKLITDINQNHYQILIGTQILSKGHHFPRVSLVIVLDVDAGLFSADVRATEKLAQLITQLSGRAGRESSNGEMWLQTHHPEHPLLQDLVNNGYQHFARHALSERKAAQGPPFSQQIVIRAEAEDSQLVHNFLEFVRHTLQPCSGIQIMGPFPASIFKRAGRFRMLIVLQSAQRNNLYGAVSQKLSHIEASPLAYKVRWAIDVAPTDMT
jgi:primosomal protein N' (replication factor Y)